MQDFLKCIDLYRSNSSQCVAVYLSTETLLHDYFHIFLVFCCVIFGHQPLGSGVLLPANNRARSAQKTCRPAYIAVSVSSLPICHNEPQVCVSVWPWPGLSYAYTHTQSREANSGQGEACTSAVFTQNPVGCAEV